MKLDPAALGEANRYLAFLEAKAPIAQPAGLPCSLDDVPTHLLTGDEIKPHQRHIVRWAVEGGRRALFEAFGLGKSIQQLLILDIILAKLWAARFAEFRKARFDDVPAAARLALGLIVCPLGVRREFIVDAAKLGINLRFVQSDAEIDAILADPLVGSYIFLTNYESVREGKISVGRFDAASLDEASVLRSYGSKTFQEFLPLFDDVPYRFVATATPSPNRYKELIHYAGFLGVMDTGQALTRFFQRNSEKAGDLTLYPHKEDEFWLWMNSWAVFLQRPSDLGFSDEGYDLPPLTVNWHCIAVDITQGADVDKRGQAALFRERAIGVVGASRERRRTLDARIDKVGELVASDPDTHFLLWHDLEDERRAIEAILPVRKFGAWEEFRDGHPDALALYDRHYSARPMEDRKLLVGPGAKMVLMTQARDALFVWRKFIDDSGQKGVNCAVFRNEGVVLSSELIREAVCIAAHRWRGERLYTYVDPSEVGGDPPGSCFLHAGWKVCGETKGGLTILDRDAYDGAPIARVECLRSVFGTQDLDTREEAIREFADGEARYLAAKPVMLGSGTNLQRHCHRAVFAGVGFKFNDFIQAIHRLQRFQQPHPVTIDIIYAETEDAVRRELLAKWKRDDEMKARMSEIIRKYGLGHAAAADTMKRSIGVDRQEATGAGWTLALNDCVEEAKLLEEGSLDLIVTSVPFSNHYEYTPSYNDFGHTDDDAHFFAQMDFLTPELLRALAPGRLACIHVKDRILFGSVTGDGVPTVNPFHAKTMFHYMKHGFQYLGMIQVNTDVVRENNQTYRLSYSEMLKDGTKMGVGSPEYVLLMRKPQTDRSRGYADTPVAKEAGDYSLARWQVDAYSMWRSSGERLAMPEELAEWEERFTSMPVGKLVKAFREGTRNLVYDFAAHVRIGETIDARDPNDERGSLPRTFMGIEPGATSPWTWDDVTRMLTLNAEQVAKGLEKHVCPLQFDIVDRLIERYSMKGELVYDPFAGLGTVPLRAVKLGRKGRGSELNPLYWAHSQRYLQEAERAAAVPTLFGLLESEAA